MNPRPARATDETGIALIAAMLVMMVCTILVGATMAVAMHTSQRSGLDRNRSAALHAAEAGIEAYLGRLSLGTCIPAADDTAETTLPDQNLPTESYILLAPDPAIHPALSCTPGGNAVIGATGFVPNMLHPVATVTIVAHVNRGQSAPSSGGTNGGYVFPDAIFTDGTLTATAGTLSTFGLGGTVPSITANGTITITDTLGQLDGPVHGWGTVNLAGTRVGGAVVGQDVAISGNGSTVLGDVTAAGGVTLSSATTVNGNVTYNSTLSGSGTITGSSNDAATILPQKRPMPLFSDNPEIGPLLGVGTVAGTSCPGTGTGTYYDYSSAAACTYNPPVVNGTVVIIAHGGGALNITVPQTSGGQLYVVNDAGPVTITGTGSTMAVFAYSSGTMTLAGGPFSGQVLGHNVNVAAPCTTAGDPRCTPATVTFVQPAIPMPDFSFPGGYSPPGSTAYPATLAYEYQCAGATTC